MRYEKIYGWNDIVGGADGPKDPAKESMDFMNEWFSDGSEGGEPGVFIQFLNLIIDFFQKIKALFA